MSTNSSSARWIPLAQLLRAQGRRGELLAEPQSNLPDIFSAGREAALSAAGATSPSGSDPVLHIEDHWFPTGKNAGRIVLKLSGCDSISDAETLAGKQLLIPSSTLPALDPDTFLVGDLLACDLYDGDTRAGRIVDVQFATGPDGRTRLEDAAPLLGIEITEGAEPILVPFVRAWLDTVDLANSRVIMHLPTGLLDALPDDEASSEDPDLEK